MTTLDDIAAMAEASLGLESAIESLGGNVRGVVLRLGPRPVTVIATACETHAGSVEVGWETATGLMGERPSCTAPNPEALGHAIVSAHTAAIEAMGPVTPGVRP